MVQILKPRSSSLTSPKVLCFSVDGEWFAEVTHSSVTTTCTMSQPHRLRLLARPAGDRPSSVVAPESKDVQDFKGCA
jgi:hypothetical protein